MVVSGNVTVTVTVNVNGVLDVKGHHHCVELPSLETEIYVLVLWVVKLSGALRIGWSRYGQAEEMFEVLLHVFRERE